MTLITVGAVAVGAAIAEMALKSVPPIIKFLTAIKDLDSSIDKIAKTAADITNFAQMRKEYGAVTTAVKGW